MTGKSSLLSPQTVAKIASVVLRSRQLALGALTGIHKSPHKGASIEFLEHKRYTPGDDVRALDWKLLARSDKHYVKQFEDETNLRAMLVVDASASMGYGPDGHDKLGTARLAAAALAYLLLSQSDAVGLLSQSGGERLYVPPRAAFEHFRAIASGLDGLQAGGGPAWLDYLTGFVPGFRRRGMFIILSDLFVDRASALDALRLLRDRRHDVILFHVLHPYEVKFPFRGPFTFSDIESPDRRLLTDPEACRDEYLAQLRQMCDYYSNQAAALEIDYQVLQSDAPLEDAIVRYLAWREARTL